MLQRVSMPKQNGHTFWTHFITLRVEMAVARLTPQLKWMCTSVQFEPYVDLEKNQVNMKPLCVKSLGVLDSNSNIQN